jgi:K+-transporting ATPase ATPase A chain
MKSSDYIQVLFYLFALIVASPLLGKYMYLVFEGKNKFFMKLEKFEIKFLSILGLDSKKEMNAIEYLKNLLFFNVLGFILLFLILKFQHLLPLNPNSLPGLSSDLSFNTAVSFMTNTNWQSYAGETTMSYFSQMIGLGVQNFVSAAVGIAVALVLIRAFINSSTSNIGNYWRDLYRSTVYLFLPLSIVFGLFLVSQGVVQNFDKNVELTTYSKTIDKKEQKQVLPMGPAASQISIKQLGSNGGGFYNANSAHPFENPTALSNFFEMLTLLAIAAGFPFLYGYMSGKMKQGTMIYKTMLILFSLGLCFSLILEYSGNPLSNSALMEGKEQRFGVTNSIIWSNATTSASNGSVNSMHSSTSPLTGMIEMFNMMTGEVIFGGVGAGFYGIMIYILVAVFVSGLMIGRTPEYLGKKIESYEIKMVLTALILPSVGILIFSAISLNSQVGTSSILNKGTHGISEVLYAYTSGFGNNGSAFAGLNANTPFYNSLIGIAMLIGRFGVIIPIMLIANKISMKKTISESEGTLDTSSNFFVFWLIAIIVIIGFLTFLPALVLGPISEHFLLSKNLLF